MNVVRFVGGELQSNGYVIYNQDCDNCYLIDTGFNGDEIIEFVKEHDLNPLGIILTHHHYDHVTDGPAVAKEFSCRIYINERDYAPLCKTLGEDEFLIEQIKDNHIFRLDEDILKCINTPGHTKGGICVYDEGKAIAFTGDTVFKDEIGITNLDDGSPEEMAHSCATFYNNLPDDVTIYPGHGDSGKMEYVKKYNEEFKQALAMEK